MKRQTRYVRRAAGRAGIALAVLLGYGVAASAVLAQGDQFEHPPMLYSQSEAKDPISDLAARLSRGEVQFPRTDDKELLRAVLEELGVPEESQVMVYSKTSLQRDRITPATPRALYFNEEYYVGWVPGGHIELTSVDPDLGAMFYLMEVPMDREKRPEITRSADCLSCHASSRTGNIPGLMVRSVYADGTGLPLLQAGSFSTDHASPLKERWGGWYVTGKSDGNRHMGNLIYAEDREREVSEAKDFGASLKTLEGVIATDAYLRPTSDIVALMVLEHQAAAHNAIFQGHYATRRMLHHDTQYAELLGYKAGEMSDTARRVIEGEADDLLDMMLFRGEFRLEGAGIEGGEEFQRAFLADAKKASSGRSLKDFQLLSRIFRLRCSYMIYSQAFDNLPEEFKEVFYRKLWEVIGGEDVPEKYGYLRDEERGEIRQILLETKEGLPDYWKE